MRGNILTQTSWKVKAVFTLTVLFATTCLLVTNLLAGYFVGDNSDLKDGWAFQEWDEDPDDGEDVRARGTAYVTTWYEAPYAKSCHNACLWNDTGIPLRYYYTFKAEVTGGPDDDDDDDEIAPKESKGEGFVADGDSWSTCKSFSFNMDLLADEEGRYTIHGRSGLEVKGDFDGDGLFQSQGETAEWKASTSTDFWHE